MSEKKKTLKPLPFPTMKRPEYVPGSRTKIQGSGGEQRHLWLRESERELLYEILSKLFPDPDNQPDWFASDIPFALIVAVGYAPQNFTLDRSHLEGIAPYGIFRLNMCLFYNRYVVPRMETKMSKRYLPPECLSEEERKIRDFSIQTMLDWLPDNRQTEASLKEFNTKLAAQLNEAGAREVDGRRFSPSSAGRFHGRHAGDALGRPTDYDRFCPEEWKKLSLEDWATQYDVSRPVPSSNEEVTSQLSDEVGEIKEVAEDADETEDKEAKNMKKPKHVEAIDKDDTKSQVKTSTKGKQGKTTAKKTKVEKSLNEETERKVQILMELFPDPLGKVPISQEELYDKLREFGLKVSPDEMGKGEYWSSLPLEYDRLYCKHAVPRLAKNIPQKRIIEKSIDEFRSIMQLYRPESSEPDWQHICWQLKFVKVITPSGRVYTPKLAREFYHQYYVPHLQKEATTPMEKAVLKGNKGKKTSAVSKAEPKSPKIDKELVEEAVAFINEKANEALYKYSIEIGNYILEKFFDGDTAAASSRNPRKVTSYRALCKHPDLGPSPGALSIMLRVAAQEKLFEANKLPVEKLSYSHKAELVTVFDDKIKVKLFKEAVKKSLNVRQLEELVRAEKGLPPSTVIGVGSEGHMTRFNFEALLKTRALSDEESLKALPEKRRNELKERVEGAYIILARLLEEYGRLKDLFADLEK